MSRCTNCGYSWSSRVHFLKCWQGEGARTYVKCVVPRCLGYFRSDVIDARGMCPESVWPADHYAYAAALAERSA